MIIEDGQGRACILRGEYMEVLLEDLREGRAGGCLIVDDQDGCLSSVVSETRVEGIVLLVSLCPRLVKEIS